MSRAGAMQWVAALRHGRWRDLQALVWERYRRPLIVLGLPALATLAALAVWLHGGRYAATENAFVKTDIIQMASEVQGRIVELTIRDHAEVRQGDVLIRLDPEPYRLALAKAEAELDSARATVEQVKVSLRETQAEFREAESRLAYLETQVKRQQELATRGASPATRLEQADSEAIQARDRAAMLRERIARVEASLGGNPNRATDEYALVREKRALRDRAALDLKHTEIRAPRGGRVVNFKSQPGEQIRPQIPLFSIVVDRRPWVEANFKETDLTHVAVGQRATVVLDIYPDIVWDAEVESISPATGAEFAILPPQNASGNWVKVVQRLPVRLRLLERPGEPALRAGMTASVSIDTGRRRSLMSLLGGGDVASTPPLPAREARREPGP
ncbi:MAG: HlyD family secretion protein [Hyphomicrobiaceae bacterium]|nr:HlyD family secretion protein [Hyphomicrobiaceae bacterium]